MRGISMLMKKLLLILSICLLIFFSIDFYLRTDRIQSKIQQKLETILHHKTEFSVATLKFKGITIYNLVVYKQGDEPLFKADKVSITFNLSKLLHKNKYKNFLALIDSISFKNAEYSFSEKLKLTEAAINLKDFSTFQITAKINEYSIDISASFDPAIILSEAKNLDLFLISIS